MIRISECWKRTTICTALESKKTYSVNTIQVTRTYMTHSQEEFQSTQDACPPLAILQKSCTSERFENFVLLLVVLSTAVGLAEMVSCQMFQRICSCVKTHPLVSVESCAAKRQCLQIRLKGGFGECLEMGWQPFSFEVVYTQNKDICVWPRGSVSGVLYYFLFFFILQKSEGRLQRNPPPPPIK